MKASADKKRAAIFAKSDCAAGAPAGRFKEKSAFLRARQSAVLRKIGCAGGAPECRFSRKSALRRALRTEIHHKILYAAGARTVRFKEKSAFLRARQSAVLREIRCAMGAGRNDFFKIMPRSRKIALFGKNFCAARHSPMPCVLEKTHRIFS